MKMPFLLLFILWLPCGLRSEQPELQVFAAASLTEALTEAGAEFQKASGIKVAFNFAASGILARQIDKGAPADLFFSADEEKMDFLQARALILVNTRKSLLSNTLTIVTPSDSTKTLQSPKELANSNWKIAIAQPETVPAGMYAKEYFKKIGIWEQIRDRLVPAENVRAALAAVESGNVDAGIVYKTDATISRAVKILYDVTAEEGPRIKYDLAIVRSSKNIDAAKDLARFLGSSTGLSIFKKYGFLTIK